MTVDASVGSEVSGVSSCVDVFMRMKRIHIE